MECDIGVIANIIEAAVSEMEKNGLPTCYPYYGEVDDTDMPGDSDEGRPCPSVGECKNPNCQFKTEQQ